MEHELKVWAVSNPKPLLHVDDFIEVGTREGRDTIPERYARWVLLQMRASATVQNAIRPFMSQYPLFAEFEGKLYRVTGASRMGDVWLHSDLTVSRGYGLRVMPDRITSWITPEMLQTRQGDEHG